MTGAANVDHVFNACKEVVMRVVAEVVEYKVLKDRIVGSVWWTDEIKEVVEE